MSDSEKAVLESLQTDLHESRPDNKESRVPRAMRGLPTLEICKES